MNKKAFSLIELSIVILIIGVLIAGVTQSSRLISEFKITSARTITQSSPVNSIKGLTLWLETSMENSLTSTTNGFSPENDDKISSWNDINPQAISKINLTQSTDASRPSYTKDGINELPSLTFDGSNDILFTTTTPIAASSRNYSLIVVWRRLSDNGGNIIIEQKPLSASTANRHAAVWIDVDGNLRFTTMSNDTGVNAFGSTSLNTNYITIMNIDLNDSDGVISCYNNSNTKSQTDTTTPGDMNLANGLFSVGARATDTSTYTLFSNSLISEVIVFDRTLKQEEVESINAYLAKKYKITLN